MKAKWKNVLVGIVAAALAVAMCMMMVACGGENTGDTGSTANTYTTTFDNIETWDYCCVSINAFGDTAGVGMININSWGNKKLKLSDAGTCDGEGCSWTCELKVEDTAYTLSFIAHLVGDDATYAGEGDFTYMFQGTCSSVSGGYKLEAPTYAKVTLTGNFKRLTDGSDFADYIPSAPFSIDSNGAGDSEDTVNGKIVADYLLTTVFRGATFSVSGSSITEVTDVVWAE